jgi:CMP-N,N'-diacetyllegionaminic acid synthase
MQNILVTICARGGSKGVKGKNIKSLNGKPLISYTINQAKEWNKAKRIVVSTDSDDIAAIAMEYGAEVPFRRPAELASDSAPKVPSIRHALIKSEEIFGMKFDIVVDLDPTSPIRKSDDIDNCLKIFNENKPKTLFSVVNCHKNPYFNMVEINEKGRYELSKKLSVGVGRRQDAPKVYDMNASIYLYSREFLIDESNNFPICDDSLIYVMDDSSSYDIDREIDFKFIEFLLKENLVNI